jgi:hypothetical protein
LIKQLKLTDSIIENNQPFIVYSFPSVSHSTETINLPNQSKPTAKMPRPSRPRSLTTGVRVSGPFGELVANPNGHKRRMRSRICGVIVGDVGENKYKVRFENDKEIDCVSSSLRIESHDLGVPLSEAQTLLAQAEEHDNALFADDEEEEDDDEGLGYLLAAVEQEVLAEDGNIETDPLEDLFGHQDKCLHNLNGSRAPSPANVLWTSNKTASDSVSNALANAVAAAAKAVTASNNTNSLAASSTVQATTITPTSVENPGFNTAGDADISGTGDGSGDQHAIKLRFCKQKIKNLKGTSVEIKSKNQVVKWTVAEDVDPPVVSGAAERPNLGMHAFDFEDCPSDELFVCMFLELLWTEINSQLSLFNAGILDHNNALPSCRQKIKIFTKSYLIIGYALFIAVDGFNEKGLHLFTSDQDDDSSYPPPGFDKHMKYHRFKVWKQFVVQVNEDGARKRDDDPW